MVLTGSKQTMITLKITGPNQPTIRDEYGRDYVPTELVWNPERNLVGFVGRRTPDSPEDGGWCPKHRVPAVYMVELKMIRDL